MLAPETAISPPVTAGATGGRIAARRWIGAAVALAAAVVLGVAAYLEPSPLGIGTHTQLGGPTCGWLVIMDIPCPTCGMTTAFAHAADGNLWAAFRTQPMGAVLAVGTAAALLIGVYVAVTGSRVVGMFGRLWGRRTAWALGIAFGGGWVYKLLVYKGLLG